MKGMVSAQYVLELFCTCPKCNEYVDVLSTDEYREDPDSLNLLECETDLEFEITCTECGDKILLERTYF